MMECHTTQPGVQLWTFNRCPEGLVCTGGVPVSKHGGFCLETQNFPDAIHHPGFPSCVLRPGEVFVSRTEPTACLLMADDEDIQHGWQVFKALLNYWQTVNKYCPEWATNIY